MKRKIFVTCAFCLLSAFVIEGASVGRQWKSSPFSVNLSEDAKKLFQELPHQSTKSVDMLDGLNLQGIWKVGKNFKAMISQKVVAEGTSFSDYHVKHILKNKVVLESKQSNKLIELELYKK